MDGFVFGAVVLLVLWYIGRLMDAKRHSQEESKRVQGLSRDPEAVARTLVANLNRTKINMALASSLPPHASARYMEESFLALASAQLLAIDRGVQRLDVRGPLIGHFKKQFSAGLQERFETYKQAYTQHSDITAAFAANLGLVGHELLAANLAPVQAQFLATLQEATKDLRAVGFAA